MPYELPLSRKLANDGWQVKIHDAEGPEEPHATIWRKWRKWRVSLRDLEFLEDDHKWSQLDKDLKKEIQANLETLQKEWDKLHGKYNPISSQDHDDDNEEK